MALEPKLICYKFGVVILAFLYCNIAICLGARTSKHLTLINDDNWRDILHGEWMINFYSRASWCPACREIERPWNAFADWSVTLKKQNLKVAQVDVSENPGLSGRFLVTALPTVYHVKEGVFRVYTGVKDKEDFIKFFKQKQWANIEKIPSWSHPDSVQMSLVSALFKFSMKARDLHRHLVEQRGLPSILSFCIFGSITLMIGCILGFFMVMLIDRFVPSGKTSKKKTVAGQQSNAKKKDAKNSSQAAETNNKQAKNGSQQKNGAKNGSVNNGLNHAENNESRQKIQEKETKKQNNLSNDLANTKNSDKKRD